MRSSAQVQPTLAPRFQARALLCRALWHGRQGNGVGTNPAAGPSACSAGMVCARGGAAMGHADRLGQTLVRCRGRSCQCGHNAGGALFTTPRLLRAVDTFAPDLVHIVKPRAYAGLVQWVLWQRRRRGIGDPPIVLDIDDWEQAWAPVNKYPVAPGPVPGLAGRMGNPSCRRDHSG